MSKYKTISGIDLPQVAKPIELNYGAKLGDPGSFPYTRGIQETMYRGKTWTMRQYAGFGSAKATNERYKFLLSKGTTGLSVAFDLPTQMGRDSDDSLSQGEVGKVGVPICTIEDMEILLKDLPLDQISVSMTINATAHILLAFYLVVARRRGISWEKLSGTIQNDVLKEYIARGTYIYPPKPALRIVTDIFSFCSKNVPRWNTISVSGYHIREAGSDAVQELAFTIADAIAYVEAAIVAGLKADEFLPRVAFFLNCHNQFLEEVAKFRAARRIWAKLTKERFSATNPKSQLFRFHTQTAGSSLTAQQPQVNIVRTTLQALSAVFGGTQSLHTNSFDEALGLPTEQSALIALRTQQVIAEESGVADVADPFGGSYLIEQLTDEIENRVNNYLEKIDKLGGMVKAIELGFPQREIEEASYQYQKGIEDQTLKIVGVNCHQSVDSESVPIQKIDPRLATDQLERLKSFLAKRSEVDVKKLLAQLKVASLVEKENLMPIIIDAVDAGATLGEISNVLRETYGEYGS
jgi:methylmalonyl-CoA mutase N-terminal domain/subunit